EIVLLLDPLQLGRGMQRTFAVDQILFLLERFAPLAVPPLVAAFVDVSRVMDPLHDLGDARAMPRLRGADDIIEGHVEMPPGARELVLHPVAVLERRESLLLC